MRAVVLIDTSVFCALLKVPNLAEQHGPVRGEIRTREQAGERLLLPFATILETGNHIAQNGDGRQRRAAAERFVEAVRASLDGRAPWVPTQLPEGPVILKWLDVFPDYAGSSDPHGKGIGLGDVSIVEEWKRQCLLNPARRVLIWSFDQHLSCYDRQP